MRAIVLGWLWHCRPPSDPSAADAQTHFFALRDDGGDDDGGDDDGGDDDGGDDDGGGGDSS